MRHVILEKSMMGALKGVKTEIIFVHGAADGVTDIGRIHAAALELSAPLIVTGDTHHTYLSLSSDRIREVSVSHE